MSRLMSVLFVLTALACAHPNAPPMSPQEAEGMASRLLGGEWVLKEIDGSAVIDSAEATLMFLDEGRAAGRASCNRFTGSFKVRDRAMGFGPLASTKMACAAPVNEQEVKYLAALRGANRYAFDGADLLIYSIATDKPLRFTHRALAPGTP